MKQPTKAELVERLRHMERELNAMREWFTCERKSGGSFTHHIPEGDGRYAYVVHVHGADRTSGGVASLECVGLNDVLTYPQYLDDLLHQFRNSQYHFMRDAVADIEAKRTRCLFLARAKQRSA